MNGKIKNVIIAVLCIVIASTAAISVYTISRRRAAEEPNPNVTLVTAPEQTAFEEHPEWTAPAVEAIDYGENLALGKEVYQNGHTQIYHSRNINDGDRFTYWEGMADAYPNMVTIDMGAAVEMTGAQILLNPRAIWSARTQDVEVQISDDGFDPMEDNSAYVAFGEVVEAQFIRFVFYANTGAKAGQAAEIEVYGS